MDGLKRDVNDDCFRVDGDKNMRLLAFAFTIVFVWTGPQCNLIKRAKHPRKSLIAASYPGLVISNAKVKKIGRASCRERV